MAQVHLDVVADPAHVRVVRLVAVSLARVHGVDEDVVEDVRLAVGEACGRAVAAHTRAAVEVPVQLRFEGSSGSGPGLVVEVVDGIALPEATGDRALALLEGPDAVDGGQSLHGLDATLGADGELAPLAAPEVMALLEGLADEVSLSTGSRGTSVRLRWAIG